MIYLNRTKRCKHDMNEPCFIIDLDVDHTAAMVNNTPTITQPPLYT